MTSTREVADDDNCCFICLGSSSSPELGPLGRHCNCPALYSHRSCLTRWQLQNAGKPEERHCRFCGATLTDWRQNIQEVPSSQSSRKSAPIMAVVFQGKTVKVPVVTGPEGVADFKKTVCKLFNLPEGTDFEVTFECKSPVFGDKLHLKGFDCFEAASYCAAVSAAKRANHKAARAAQTAVAANANATSHSLPGNLCFNGRNTNSSQANTGRSTTSNSSQGSSEASAESPVAPSRTNASLVRRLLCATQLDSRSNSSAGHANVSSAPTSSANALRRVSPMSTEPSSSPAVRALAPLPPIASEAPPAVHVATTTSGSPVSGAKECTRAMSLTDLFRRIL